MKALPLIVFATLATPVCLSQVHPEVIEYTFESGDATNSAIPGVGNGTTTAGLSFVASNSCLPGLAAEANGATPSQINTGYQMDLGLGDWTIGMHVYQETPNPSLQYYFRSNSTDPWSNGNGFRCFSGGLAGPNGMILESLISSSAPIFGVHVGGTSAHVAWVHDASTFAVHTYLNGAYQDSFPTVNGQMVMGTSPDFVLMDQVFPGTSMDDFRLYRRALTSVELAHWANCGDSGGLGTLFCYPADNNSTGLPCVLTASNTSGPGTGVHLEARQGPPQQFGYFLVGTGVADPGLPLSNGHFCLSFSSGNVIGRYNLLTPAMDSTSYFGSTGILGSSPGTSTVGTGFDVPSTLPLMGSPTIQSGQTWHFQLWYRDGGGSNFSNGLRINF